MTTPDLIFWYTGSGVWTAIALILAFALMATALKLLVWLYRKGRVIAMEWLCVAEIRDMGLTLAVLRDAFAQEFGDEADITAIIAKLSRVQTRLRGHSAICWDRRDYSKEMSTKAISHEQVERAGVVLKRYLCDPDNYQDRGDMVREVIQAVFGTAAPVKDAES